MFAVRRLSWRLLLATATPVTLALLATSVIFSLQGSRAIERCVLDQTLADARLIAAALRPDWPNVDDEKFLQYSNVLAASQGEFVVLDGERVIARSRSATTQSARSAPLASAEDASIAVGDSFVRDDPQRGRIAIASALIAGSVANSARVIVQRPLDSARLRRDWTWAGLLALVGIGAATVAALVVSQMRRWGSLLVKIAQTARSISAGDLGAPIDAQGSRELELLGRSIDQMRVRLVRQVAHTDRQRITFQALLTQLREGVIVANAEGRVVLLNPAAIELLSLPRLRDLDSYVGLAVERCVPQLELQRALAARTPDARDVGAAVTGDSNSGRTASSISESRLEVETPTGTRHLMGQISDIVLPGMETPAQTGRMLVLTDITDLTRNIRMKTDFVANASHELRTPLSTIRAAVETLQHVDPVDDASAARKYLNVIERQSARLEALASDLLDLSRVESAEARWPADRVALSEFFSDIRTHFAEQLASRNVQLEIQTDVENAELTANTQLLRLVIDNLIDNAIKFSELGQVVRLECRRSPDRVTFVVRDSGCGISAVDQQRVFERFYQVERARTVSSTARGTGLGLSIVRHAVSVMEGSVSLESTPGRGTTVTVTLPQAAPRASW